MLKRVIRVCGKIVSSDLSGQRTILNAKSVERLRTLAVSREATVKVLFEGIDPNEVDFSSVFTFAAELLTHLAIAYACYDYYSAVGKIA